MGILKSIKDKFSKKDEKEHELTPEEFSNLGPLEQQQVILDLEGEWLQESVDLKKEYTFFGYFMEPIETPHFHDHYFDKNGQEHESIVYVYTPDMLIHCVECLTPSQKLYKAKDIESFKYMCNQIAESGVFFEKAEWDLATEECVEHLQQWLRKRVVEKTNRVSLDTAKNINWNEFGKQIKKYLPHSYDRKPKSVEIQHAGNNSESNLNAKLKFVSKTTPSFRTVKVDFTNGDVSQSVNGSVNYKYDENMTATWHNFYEEYSNGKYMQ